jgi:hypothetical protein
MSLHYMVGSGRTLLSHSYAPGAPGHKNRLVEELQLIRQGGSCSTPRRAMTFEIATVYICPLEKPQVS